MTPAIVQLLEELSLREPAYKKPYNRASGFMCSRVHARTLPRAEVDGPKRLQITGLELKTNKDLKEDLHAHLHSFRRKVYDPDMHATILLGLMQEAAAEPAGERS